MATFFIVTIFIINVSLWVVLIVKFKRLFSTDDIISSTRAELTKMLADVNRNTDRDLMLMEDKIKELKAVIAEADRHLSVAKNELERQQQVAAFEQRLVAGRPNGYAMGENGVQDRGFMAYEQAGDGFSTARTSPYDAVRKNLNKPNIISSPTGTTFSVEAKESKSVVNSNTGDILGVPRVHYAEKPIVPKKSFADSVKDLYQKGNSVEEIAMMLGTSTTEVQFVIDMNF